MGSVLSATLLASRHLIRNVASPMKRKLLIALPLLLVALSLIVWFVDPFLVGVFFYVPLLAAAPCFVIGLGLLIVSKARTQQTSQPVTLISAGVALACIAWPTVTANRWVHDRAVEDAKNYPELVNPLLEDYRLTHGGYPQSLEQLPSKPPVPRLLRTSFSYRSDGKGYSFAFAQPGGLIDTWDYDSTTHTWHLST